MTDLFIPAETVDVVDEITANDGHATVEILPAADVLYTLGRSMRVNAIILDPW